ncbi:MAG TPA: hypothetical protein VME43_12240 [Bryobacteraceae bacterium]|nr:hypothetical protein [Bryobacteraceae bacterium]
MRRQILRFAPWVALMVMGLIGTSRPANTEPQERHPRIRAAVEALRDANEYMRSAPHDFCGHKVEAMRATDAAIRQLELARACAR